MEFISVTQISSQFLPTEAHVRGWRGVIALPLVSNRGGLGEGGPRLGKAGADGQEDMSLSIYSRLPVVPGEELKHL